MIVYTAADRRNMEPPDDGYYFCNAHNMKAAFCIFVFVKVSQSTLRIRGGGDTDDKYNVVPSLTDMRFMWDGLPCIDFRERIMYPLENGLGAVYVKGSNQTGGTLLQTVRRIDAGGVLGNPARLVAPQAVIDDSNARNVKAFHTILNYISRSSETYMMLVREYAIESSGIAVYELLPAIGTITTPPKVVKMRSDAWSRMSMDILRIPYNEKGYFRWVDAVELAGRKLNKTPTDIKEKFIDGLPSFFDSVKVQMRHDNSHLYPNTYGNLPGSANHPQAANAHPFALQPFMKLMAIAYFSDWMAKSSAVIKDAPPRSSEPLL